MPPPNSAFTTIEAGPRAAPSPARTRRDRNAMLISHALLVPHLPTLMIDEQRGHHGGMVNALRDASERLFETLQGIERLDSVRELARAA